MRPLHFLTKKFHCPFDIRLKISRILKYTGEYLQVQLIQYSYVAEHPCDQVMQRGNAETAPQFRRLFTKCESSNSSSYWFSSHKSGSVSNTVFIVSVCEDVGWLLEDFWLSFFLSPSENNSSNWKCRHRISVKQKPIQFCGVMWQTYDFVYSTGKTTLYNRMQDKISRLIHNSKQHAAQCFHGEWYSNPTPSFPQFAQWRKW